MKTEPRTVTLEQIEAEIASEHYFTAQEGVMGAAMRSGAACWDGTNNPLNLLTFCILVMRNGFTVTGQSACADPAKFNAEKGREIARADAIRQCWALLGFRLRDQMATEVAAAPSATIDGGLAVIRSGGAVLAVVPPSLLEDLANLPPPSQHDGGGLSL